MHGQWLGKIEGTNSGWVAISIDPDRLDFAVIGVCDPKAISFSAVAVIQKNGDKLIGTLEHFRQHPVLPAFEEAVLPKTGTFKGIIHDNQISGQWTTGLGTVGDFQVQRTDVALPREADHVWSWREFRDWVLLNQDAHRGWLWRGHRSSTWPLITAFHRTGRRNIIRFNEEDVPNLRRAIEATISTRYSLDDPYDRGALINLAQHHGFPTPLLDWSESPFVAAYFAFESVDAHTSPNTVRVFAFDGMSWSRKYKNFTDSIIPAISLNRFGAHGNPRVLPQQSINMYSSIVDIEGFVSAQEKADGCSYLIAVDVPASEKDRVIAELTTMGITASSLFPGIDGVCRTLKERWF